MVKLGKREVVATPLPMQEHWLPFSNLDLLLPPLDVGRLEHGSTVGILKAALAQALVSYYALAREVAQNSAGEPALLCSNQGVDFIEAFADVEPGHFNLYNLDETIEGKLVPTKKRGVLVVQVLILNTDTLYVVYPFQEIISPRRSSFCLLWMELNEWKNLAREDLGIDN
ncbi:hypothetical protein EUGRSUZ_E02702 [Eucalyptus grandis]|uniref:Uncharacterized protein n=2 Tax=Eucalyptus grandis TaxID=71139 RepID=A0ACC3KXQ3_EUCGR|nr:hypothetical protein EUGRSUZ_E02702 [Eucalyptus grandis]